MQLFNKSDIITVLSVQLLENEQKVHDLKVQLTTLQGNHKESMEQLGDKSQQVAILKTEMSRLQQQNQVITDEVMVCH